MKINNKIKQSKRNSHKNMETGLSTIKKWINNSIIRFKQFIKNIKSSVNSSWPKGKALIIAMIEIVCTPHQEGSKLTKKKSKQNKIVIAFKFNKLLKLTETKTIILKHNKIWVICVKNRLVLQVIKI